MHVEGDSARSSRVFEDVCATTRTPGGDADERAVLDVASSSRTPTARAMHERLDALEGEAELTVESFLRARFDGATTTDVDSVSDVCAAGGDAREDSLYAADTDLEEAEEVDPRVGDALNELNDSMSECNSLENELQRARRERTSAHERARTRLDEASRSLSSSVRTAVPVFHRRALAQLYQVRSIEALRAYEAAHDAHEQAKRRNDELEHELLASSGKFDVELMEACADAMREVADTASVKTRAAEVHERNARRAVEATAEAAGLERARHAAVKRAQPFFNAKALGERECADADDRVSELKLAVKQAKARYDSALRALNEISEEVHARREARRRERTASVDLSLHDDRELAEDS